MNRITAKRLFMAALVMTAVILLLFVQLYGAGITNLQALKSSLLVHCQGCYHISSYFYNTLLGSELISPYFYVALSVILLLTRLIPADPKQRVLAVNFWQDALWFLAYLFFIFALLRGYESLLRAGYERQLDFLRVEAVSRWPVPLQIVMVVLVNDFLAWFHHLVRHKVPWFWHFHTIHHAQRQMSPFTDLRNHPVDTLIAHSIRFLPMVSLTSHAAYPFAAGWIFFSHWYPRFYHANLKINYGPLRHLLVTPQSHRVHHSIEHHHHDRNFGVIFSIWDRIFGTQYCGYNEYPATGIAYRSLAPRTNAKLGGGPAGTFTQQLLYPFERIFASLHRRPSTEP